MMPMMIGVTARERVKSAAFILSKTLQDLARVRAIRERVPTVSDELLGLRLALGLALGLGLELGLGLKLGLGLGSGPCGRGYPS